MLEFPEIQNILFLRVLLADVVFAWVAVCGNIFFLWAFFSSKKKKIQTVPNYLLCAQCIPDIGLGFVVGILGTLAFITRRIPGPAWSTFQLGMEVWQGPVCSLYGFSIHLFGFSSGYTHVLLAWERFSSIVWPFRRKISLKFATLYYILIWIAALGFATAPFLQGGFYLRPARTNCSPLLVPGPISVLVVVFILLAANLLIFGYVFMFIRIKRVLNFGGSESFLNNLRAERKIALQFLIIVNSFLIFCLPASFTWFVALTRLFGAPTSYIFKKIELFGFLFSTLNSAINPFLYMAVNKSLRKMVCVRLGMTKKHAHIAHLTPSVSTRCKCSRLKKYQSILVYPKQKAIVLAL